MSSTIPPQLEGSHAPSALEILWEKHRRKVNALFWLLAIGLAGFYGWRFYNQSLINREWSQFAANALLRKGYDPGQADPRMAMPLDISLLTELRDASLTQLEGNLATAAPHQRPYFLWLIANKATLAKDWEKAEATLAQLEKEAGPDHALCRDSGFPVQVRAEEKPAEDSKKPDRQAAEPKLKPAKKGSMVGMLREEIAAAKAFKLPESFDKPAIPENAPRYKIKFSGDHGEITIALLCDRAPKHCEEFQKLVDEKFWDEIKIDEIDRPMRNAPKFYWSMTQFHFGLPITKTETDRTKWDASKPSQRLVEEVTGLSHFPGAVACRQDADGKSSVDRIWICAEDLASSQDGQRQVIGYVLEGDLEVVKRICEVSLSNEQEEQMGRGKPDQSISIVSVTRM